ncbi:MAG: hypothetical protein PUI89_02475 [Bacteroidales bacterium]|uniref:hypothetical protein n=1 Tax=Porphyromonas sp. TaxID=1924944 RepID=UPI002A837EA2|nr:hypothetical protein [Porphyromonas sp.]MDD6928145.1 hypothetical protein [Bacteroidales bacterium]MDY4244872.1 hypothetical protein [Porphyromonas sp.]
MSKALLIKSYTNLTTGTPGEWNELNMPVSYIQGIETGKILDDLTADKLNTLISGIPTPWARAKLFKFALNTLATPDPNIDSSGLQQFYEMLYDEWKGLLAVIALYPDRIRFSNPIEMDVNGQAYGIASSFGRMLFDERDLWSNQDKLATEPDTQPFIQLIYYRDCLVGGTSPMTGVFTGVEYDHLPEASDISWYRGGRFESPDPYLSPDHLQKLYLFVKNLNSNLRAFEEKINSQRGSKPHEEINGFKQMSRLWEEELRQRGSNLRDRGPIASYPNLECPFSLLFESNVPVYLKLDDYTFTYTNEGGGEYKLIGDIQKLLSDDKFVIGWVEDEDARPKLSEAPVFYLKTKDLQSKKNYYFTIPLSESGVDVFKNDLSGMLGYSDSDNVSLSGVITDSGQLAATLSVKVDGQRVTLNTREYAIHWMTDLGKVIMWPNFVSEHWSKYYLYSEFTADAQELFEPIFKVQNKFIKTINGSFWTGDYQAEVDEPKQVDVKKLITYPAGEGEDLHKYNIICTDKPLGGVVAYVKDMGKPSHAGFLIFRPQIVEDRTSLPPQTEAVVGIDFGSNNTCLFYNEGDREPAPIQFENYRLVVVGKENNNLKAVAENNELLFFSNYPATNGQIKSWLHEQDSRYNTHNEALEIAGGVPVNRPNVLVRKMDRFAITTQAGTLHYNMKWLSDNRGLLKKSAFLKTIWLQACAYLYKNRIRPAKLVWSYPGSMMPADRTELERIYEDLCKLTPISNQRKPELSDQLTTEAEAVCSFALSQEFGLNVDNLFLGIDVGGSTSDILILGKDPNNGNRVSLLRESSVRMAAGVFFNTVIKSQEFREALISFHEGRRTNVNVSNIKALQSEPSKAPYFLNSIFDQLQTEEEYDEFYRSIDNNAKSVFTIPAYVTGLLLFYSGMLIGKTIKVEQLDQVSRVDVLSFGKGGRLFHWLKNSAGNRLTNEYYGSCLNAGVRCVIDKELQVSYREEIAVDNKAEVAKGLVNSKELHKKESGVSSDICGEDDVKYTMEDGSIRTLLVDDELTGDYFTNEMNNFTFQSVPNFEKFINIFIDFVCQKTHLYPQAESLYEDLADLPNRIASFICNSDDEYKKARSNQRDGFHYHQPLIIAEGACFLETLIKRVFN